MWVRNSRRTPSKYCVYTSSFLLYYLWWRRNGKDSFLVSTFYGRGSYTSLSLVPHEQRTVSYNSRKLLPLSFSRTSLEWAGFAESRRTFFCKPETVPLLNKWIHVVQLFNMFSRGRKKSFCGEFIFWLPHIQRYCVAVSGAKHRPSVALDARNVFSFRCKTSKRFGAFSFIDWITAGNASTALPTPECRRQVCRLESRIRLYCCKSPGYVSFLSVREAHIALRLKRKSTGKYTLYMVFKAPVGGNNGWNLVGHGGLEHEFTRRQSMVICFERQLNSSEIICVPLVHNCQFLHGESSVAAIDYQGFSQLFENTSGRWSF